MCGIAAVYERCHRLNRKAVHRRSISCHDPKGSFPGVAGGAKRATAELGEHIPDQDIALVSRMLRRLLNRMERDGTPSR